jgi:hypothetical protein
LALPVKELFKRLNLFSVLIILLEVHPTSN